MYTKLNITMFEILYKGVSRNSDPIHFASQLLREKGLLALEVKEINFMINSPKDNEISGLQNLIIKWIILYI